MTAKESAAALAEKECVPCKGGVPPLGEDERGRLLQELGPLVLFGDDVLEGAQGVALLADVRQDAPLDVVELRWCLAEATSAGAVRQEAIVQLVGRTDALALDRLRHAIRTVREHAVHAPGEFRSLPVHVPLGPPSGGGLPYRRPGNLRLLPVP